MTRWNECLTSRAKTQINENHEEKAKDLEDISRRLQSIKNQSSNGNNKKMRSDD